MGPAVLSSFCVRSYEADSYAHLNNGVYLGWFEQGRLDWLLSQGFSYDGFAARREWFVVARTEVDFRRPLVTGECARLVTRVAALGRSSVRFHQVLRRWDGHTLPLESRVAHDDEDLGQGLPCAEALTIMVFTDQSSAIPIPDDFRAAVEGPAAHGAR
ncbi:MAG: acyl-CoA thioesterase [Planctomycetes bacterium]|nr:acyl-CoA thioesterase [Planctomycetota bacterium]